MGGTYPECVYAIMTEGFKIGNICWGRERGRGLYLSTLAGSLRWGDYVVKCRLKRGFRILWQREYGAGILRPGSTTLPFIREGGGDCVILTAMNESNILII